MVYTKFAWIKQRDPRDPDYNADAPTLDEMLDARADNTLEEWREEQLGK